MASAEPPEFTVKLGATGSASVSFSLAPVLRGEGRGEGLCIPQADGPDPIGHCRRSLNTARQEPLPSQSLTPCTKHMPLCFVSVVPRHPPCGHLLPRGAKGIKATTSNLPSLCATLCTLWFYSPHFFRDFRVIPWLVFCICLTLRTPFTLRSYPSQPSRHVHSGSLRPGLIRVSSVFICG